jgi:hypothetical protein
MNGNCYWFALILKERFPQKLNIYYISDTGHFVGYDGKSNYYYDWEGSHLVDDTELISLDMILCQDPKWFSRLMNDCKM